MIYDKGWNKINKRQTENIFIMKWNELWMFLNYKNVVPRFYILLFFIFQAQDIWRNSRYSKKDSTVTSGTMTNSSTTGINAQCNPRLVTTHTSLAFFFLFYFSHSSYSVSFTKLYFLLYLYPFFFSPNLLFYILKISGQ